MKITFFGGVETVTGSKYFVEQGNTKILVDCGLFQGSKDAYKLNWNPFPVDASTIDAVVLTHAHIDHTGYIPLLIKNGFKGKIYCSQGTYALASLLLIDSGMLQEEDANRANKYGYSSHHPALPLYTAGDAAYALNFFQVIDFDKVFTIANSLRITLVRSYHILGASFVIISDGKKTLTFSGDLGRPNELIMKAPTHLKKTDYLVLESTYGDRLHEEEDPLAALAKVINETVKKDGSVVIPAFAVGRTQTILYCLYELRMKNIIPDIPIFLDSPMAINVSNLFCDFKDEHKLPTDSCTNVFNIATYARTVEESKHIDNIQGPRIVISASGMATGGRILHHVKHFIEDPKNTILFVGFQGGGTLGRKLIEGAKEIEIHGRLFSVRAVIKKIDTLSAHADYNEILEWLSYFESNPKKVFITHGEIASAQSLKEKIEKRFGWTVVIPKYLETFYLE